jgi:hypothetical protein
MLVYVRPSNEALLRARVPGAQDQRGCPSPPFHRGASASKKDGLAAPLLIPSLLVPSQPRVVWIGPQLRTSNDHSFTVGVP